MSQPTHLNMSKRVCLFFVFLFIAGVVFASVPGRAVTVGVYRNEPKIFIDEKDNPSGIFIELLEEIAKQEKWHITYITGTWEECLQNLQTGTIDLLPDVAFSFSREKDLDFNKISVIDSWSCVYAHPQQKIVRFSDLSGKRISMLRGSIQEKVFNQFMNGFAYDYTIIPANSFEIAFSNVRNGLADAVITNQLFGEMHYTRYGLTKTLIVFNPASLHFAVKKGTHADLLDVIDGYLARWTKAPGSFYYKTILPYLSAGSESRERRMVWTAIFSFLTLLLICLVLIFLFRKKFISNKSDLIDTCSQLRKENEKLRDYFELAPLAILVTGKSGHYVEANQAACDMTGYERDELIGRSIPDLIPAEEHADALDHFKQVTTKGRASGKYTFIHHSGEKRRWNVDAVRISDDRFIGFVSEITDKERDQRHLDRLGKIIESSLNEIYIFDPDSLTIVEANKAALVHTGYSHEEILRMTPLDLKLDLNPESFYDSILPLKNNPKRKVVLETRHYRKDKSFYEVEAHIQLIEYDKGPLFAAIILDISERKKAENELKSLKDKLEQQIEEKTTELRERVAELEYFHQVTIEREIRMKEISDELKALKDEAK